MHSFYAATVKQKSEQFVLHPSVARYKLARFIPNFTTQPLRRGFYLFFFNAEVVSFYYHRENNVANIQLYRRLIPDNLQQILQ